MVVVGEASGDHHASKVVQAFNQTHPGWSFWGIGGDRLEKAGMELVAHCKELSVVGIKEVVLDLPRIWRLFKSLLRLMDERQPDALLLVDAPDFNLRLAREAKKRNIPVYYYIAPQVWAWREGRISLMKEVIDRLYVIFPFEKEYFRERGIQAIFCGHPVLDEPWVEDHVEAREYREKLDVHGDYEYWVSLMPGSRKSEWKNNLSVMVESARALEKKIDRELCFILPVAHHLDEDFVSRSLKALTLPKNLHVVSGRSIDCMKAADFGWVASGTATLEAALAELPMAVVYRVARFTAFLFKNFARYQGSIGMVNLVSGIPVVPELIQEEACPERLCQVAEAYLKDPKLLRDTKLALKEVKSKLGEPGSSIRVAEDLWQQIGESKL
jgi:lipid-A-disaccharide synthase